MNYLQSGFKGKNEFWMYFVMFFLVLAANVFGQIPLTIVAVMQVEGDMTKLAESNQLADIGINSNLYLFLVLLAFIASFFVFILALKVMHKKKLKWVVTSRNKVDWSRIGFGAFIWGMVLVAATSLDIYLSPENYVWNFKPESFAVLFLVAVVCIPIQTTLEELLFRGYYMQGMAIWLKNKWIPLVVMSCVFGLLHGFNPEVAKLGYLILIFYIASGFFFGVVTLLDEGTELAIGMHAINNIIAALFVTANWTVFQTDALYVDVSEPSITFEMFLPLIVLYPLTILILSKKYGWKNWKEKLFGEVEQPAEQDLIDEIGS